jgi:hypothetical protein
LERLEDRVVPSIPDGTILVTTSHSAFSSVPQDSFPVGIIGMSPSTGSQFPISTGGLFSVPTYVAEAPDGQLYVTDLQAFSTGIIIRVDTNNTQHLVARGGFLNGPNALAYVDGLLYVGNTGDGSGSIHSIVRVDPSTGAQTLISNGDTGTSTGGNTATTLNDTTKNWKPNQWAGWSVLINGNTGLGQWLTVVSNTATQLTLAGSWATIPDSMSTYEIGFSVPTGMTAYNGNILVSDEPGGSGGADPGGVWQVNLTTGVQTILTHGGYLVHATDIALEPSGNLLTMGATSATDSLGSIVRVNPTTGVQTQVSHDGILYYLDGMTVDPSTGRIYTGAISTGNIPAAMYAVDPVTGAQSQIAQGGLMSLVEGIRIYHTTVQTASTTTVTSSANPSVPGQSVTFTAAVTSSAGGRGTPTGTVQFQIDGTNFGSPVSLSGGLATSLATNSLSVSGHTVTAVYSGDPTFSGSTAVMIQNVNVMQNITLMPDPVDPTLLDLVVVGTAGDDHIQIQRAPDGKSIHVMVEETKPDHFQYQADYTTSGLARLVVYGGAGNDHIEVDNKLLLPAVLFAGAGNDHIQAGGGPTVIVGGSGDDHLEGSSGRDIMIAGSGTSHLEGKEGDDILIAGTTAFDGNLAALIAILDEWSRTDESYLQRVANLQDSPINGVSPNSSGLNGSYVLNASTVHDSGAGDQLDGGPGMAWFFANLDGIGNNGVKDKLNGSKPGQVITRITF